MRQCTYSDNTHAPYVRGCSGDRGPFPSGSGWGCSDVRRQRGNAPDLYEEEDLQQHLARFYATIEKYLPGDRVLHLDGNADADTVHAGVLAAVEALRAEG